MKAALCFTSHMYCREEEEERHFSVDLSNLKTGWGIFYVIQLKAVLDNRSVQAV